MFYHPTLRTSMGSGLWLAVNARHSATDVSLQQAEADGLRGFSLSLRLIRSTGSLTVFNLRHISTEPEGNAPQTQHLQVVRGGYLISANLQLNILFTSPPSIAALSGLPPSSRCLASAPATIVKLDSRDTPPPLHHSPATSDLERASTAEPTPLGTPRGLDSLTRRRPEKEKEKDLLFSWHRRAHGLAGNSSYVDSTLLECDFGEPTFPLFGEPMTSDMAYSGPIDITTTSPRQNQASNLTSALQSTTGNEMRPTQAMSIIGSDAKMNGFGNGHHDSRDSLTSAMAGADSRHGSGAQPISMSREKPRRESLASSMVGGMSWGGVSVNSWVRDE